MNIWLVGGDKVIPTSVEKAIQGDGYTVKRISGEDRYETAAQVAEAGISLSGKKPSKVFVASGTSFADALAVSPVAFAKGYPIILTEKDATSDFSKKELGNIGTDAKILVGGESVVSKAVAANLSIKEDARVAGEDRAATANLVSDWAKKSEGFNPANAALVGGTNGNGADSLVASALGGKSFTTLHFAGWDATQTYFKDHAAELTGKGFVFGGKAAVSQGDVDKAQSATQTVVSKQSIKVTPSDAVSLPSSLEHDVKGTDEDESKRGERKFSVSGLDDKKTYTIALYPAKNVLVDKSGAVTFLNDSGTPKVSTDDDLVADFDAPKGARVVSLNNSKIDTPATSGIVTATPVSGTLLFSLNAQDADDVVPVVFINAAGGTANTGSVPGLDIDKAGNPTETFGVAGRTTWSGVELTSDDGSVASAVISAVDKKAHNFTVIVDGDGSDTDPYVYRAVRYDDNDVLTLNGKRVTVSDLEKQLSRGDTVTITSGKYFQNSSFSSEIAVEDTDITPEVATSLGNGVNSQRVTVSIAPAEVDGIEAKDYTFDVQRARGNYNEVADADFASVGSVTLADDADTTSADVVDFYDKNVAPGYWTYRVVASIDGDKSDPSVLTAGVSTERVLSPSDDKTAPILVGASVAGDSEIKAGDKIVLDFSEKLADSAVTAGAALRFADPDGEIYQVKIATSGTDAGTASVDVDDTPATTSKAKVVDGRITLTLLGAPVKVGGTTPASDAGVAQAPATVTAFSTGWADAAGNLVDLEKSTDKVIDVPFE